MHRRGRYKLKRLYYRNFLLLIVIPILLLMILSIGLIRIYMERAAFDNIRMAQDHILTTLTDEIQDVSLRLSHMVFVNDNELMDLAADTNDADITRRYHYTQKLNEAFNLIMVPTQDIAAAAFFMRDGSYTYLKDDFQMEQKEIQNAAWYQKALMDPKRVKIGTYQTNVTYSKMTAYPFTIAAGLSPDPHMNRKGNIEVAALFMSSQIGGLLKKYDKEGKIGIPILLNEANEVILDITNSKTMLNEAFWDNQKPYFQQRMHGKRYTYLIQKDKVLGYTLVNIVETNLLVREFNQIAMVIVAITMGLFALYYYFSSYFLRNIIHPVNDMIDGLKRAEEGDLTVSIPPVGQSEIRTMLESFNQMVRQLKKLMEVNQREVESKHQAEMMALQSQINPHFLVNSLNSIRFMAQVAKFDGIRKMAEALINILSSSFRSKESFHTVKEELAILDSFVFLMKIRYSDGFDIQYEVQEACLAIPLPRLILQPIVENSIVHGFSDKVEDLGIIELHMRMEGRTLEIAIRDNGKGMTAKRISQIVENAEEPKDSNQNFGVHNVRTRLHLYYGETCTYYMSSQINVYTETQIRIPLQRGEGANETSSISG